MAFVKAERTKAKLKCAIMGPSGSGKTTSAIRMARGLTSERIAVIDTENQSASLLAGRTFTDDRTGAEYAMDFDVDNIAAPYTSDKFLASLKSASGYGVVVIDSFSHVWEAVLDYKSKLDQMGGNSYVNWGDAGKKFTAVIDYIRNMDQHVIVCMRSKMAYVMQENEKGKQAPVKVGLSPIIRDGTEYEFSTLFDVDMQHTTKDEKGRLAHLFGSDRFMITEATGAKLKDFLDSGAEPPDVWNQAKKDEAKALAQKASSQGVDTAIIAAISSTPNITPSQAIAKLKALIKE